MSRASNVAGRWLGFLTIGFVLLGITGCGGKKLYPAEGRVVFDDDTPLTGGWVTFEPVDPAATKGATADIRADGKFQLGTYHPGDGAMEGKYRAVVKPPLGEGRSEKNPVPREIEPTNQEFTVTSDQKENSFTVKVKRRRQRD